MPYCNGCSECSLEHYPSEACHDAALRTLRNKLTGETKVSSPSYEPNSMPGDLHVTFMDGHFQTYPNVALRVRLDRRDPVHVNGTTLSFESDSELVTLLGVRGYVENIYPE